MTRQVPRVITAPVRVTIRVHPGSRQPGVGGNHDGALVVRVRERAVDGRATEAALTAVADALSVPRRTVTLAHRCDQPNQDPRHPRRRPHHPRPPPPARMTIDPATYAVH